MLMQTIVASYLSMFVMLLVVSALGAIVIAIIDGARIEAGRLVPHHR
jgi:hypothetical protein